MTLPLSALQFQSILSLCIIHSTADKDISPSSNPAVLVVEREGAELGPGQPQQLRVIGCRTTQVKLSWAAPEGGLKPRSYQLYHSETLLGTMHLTLVTFLGALSCHRGIVDSKICRSRGGWVVGDYTDYSIFPEAGSPPVLPATAPDFPKALG